MDPENKNKFDWEKGQVLDNENAKPLGGVRLKGFRKISDGILADPKERAKKRQEHLVEKQSQKYEDTIKQKKIEQKQIEETFVMEESESGIGDYEQQDAKGFLDKIGSSDNTSISKGVGRFGNQKKSKDD